jgi:predicted lactoylglutathione lyase
MMSSRNGFRHSGRLFGKNQNQLSARLRLVRPWLEPLELEPFMPKMIFVNLPVVDLPKATAFYEAIGAVKNPQFSDHTASCMVFSDTIYAMLMTHEKFMQFSPKKIADPKTCEVMICISADSRAEVDDIVERAGRAGGGVDPSPKDEYDFMYGRSFEDPDGHLWGVNWMDLAAAPAAPGVAADA